MFVLVTDFPRRLKTDKWSNFCCVYYGCPLKGRYMSLCVSVNMCICIRYTYMYTVNVHLSSSLGVNGFFLKEQRSAQGCLGTLYYCTLFMPDYVGASKPGLFTQKVPYSAERLTSDWPAHSGKASNLWLTHQPSFCDIIQPNGLVWTPQGNTEERLCLLWNGGLVMDNLWPS